MKTENEEMPNNQSIKSPSFMQRETPHIEVAIDKGNKRDFQSFHSTLDALFHNQHADGIEWCGSKTCRNDHFGWRIEAVEYVGLVDDQTFNQFALSPLTSGDVLSL